MHHGVRQIKENRQQVPKRRPITQKLPEPEKKRLDSPLADRAEDFCKSAEPGHDPGKLGHWILGVQRIERESTSESTLGLDFREIKDIFGGAGTVKKFDRVNQDLRTRSVNLLGHERRKIREEIDHGAAGF
jgi:hypothetical protein